MIGEDIYGFVLIVDCVDFVIGNNIIVDFVVVLVDGLELDIIKDYVLFFDNGIEEVFIELDLDRNVFVIIFLFLG